MPIAPLGQEKSQTPISLRDPRESLMPMLMLPFPGFKATRADKQEIFD